MELKELKEENTKLNEQLKKQEERIEKLGGKVVDEKVENENTTKQNTNSNAESADASSDIFAEKYFFIVCAQAEEEVVFSFIAYELAPKKTK
ncbi:hypothetical protein FQA39_LY04839 [Lamprigera yunnana]|nr:hypothetical protein FQA39_LY04839 [Lamprigera yunnana]